MNFNNFYFKEEVDMTDEMVDFFETRTKNHISLVQKYCQRIDELNKKGLEDIVKLSKVHDASKFEEPERTPYIYITWMYKCRDDGVDFEIPNEIKDQMNQATIHHIKSNKHHPDYYSDDSNPLNLDNRDKPADKIIDATKMPEIEIAEMVADWCAMSEEKGNSPKEWADQNVNIRWQFTDKQKDLIYDLIEKVWKK